MFLLSHCDPSWQSIISEGLNAIDEGYLQSLCKNNSWLPGPEKIFNAFSLPRDKTRYILFGESPYPRAESANGYAFWDAAVNELWSVNGLSKKVNRATSLRNWMKQLLIAEGLLTPNDNSQNAISKIDKTNLIKTADELFQNLISQGVLLLNATLVLQKQNPKNDAKSWRPFVEVILEELKNDDITLILWGNIAKEIKKIPVASHYNTIESEHPYNLSFIHNKTMRDFFKPLSLLNACGRDL